MRTSIILSENEFKVLNEIVFAVSKVTGKRISNSEIIRGLVSGCEKNYHVFANCRNENDVKHIILTVLDQFFSRG